jgi:GNAT superfamily N-acetyltransferase
MIEIRRAVETDLDAIVRLCAEHAAYERSTLDPVAVRRLLPSYLFGATPRARCLIVEADGAAAGYATHSREFSTWRAAEYLHMDCLYIREPFRGTGIGTQMMQRIAHHARSLGCDFIEWQTPSWNTDAIRFYDRAGAVGALKMRYRWLTT